MPPTTLGSNYVVIDRLDKKDDKIINIFILYCVISTFCQPTACFLSLAHMAIIVRGVKCGEWVFSFRVNSIIVELKTNLLYNIALTFRFLNIIGLKNKMIKQFNDNQKKYYRYQFHITIFIVSTIQPSRDRTILLTILHILSTK